MYSEILFQNFILHADCLLNHADPNGKFLVLGYNFNNV